MNRFVIYHVEILVLVQIVDLEQILRFQSVRFAAFEEHFQILPLTKKNNRIIIQLAAIVPLLESTHVQFKPSANEKPLNA